MAYIGPQQKPGLVSEMPDQQEAENKSSIVVTDVTNLAQIQQGSPSDKTEHVIDEKNLAPPSESSDLRPWFTENIQCIAQALEKIKEMVNATYSAVNPVLILQCKIGSSNAFTGGMASWAQNGFQINLVSRGVQFKKPIIQVLLHNEAGVAKGVGGMMVNNVGFSFSPNEQGEYESSFIVEDVQRVEYGDSLSQLSNDHVQFNVNGSIGVDHVNHRCWSGRKKYAAGFITAAAQTAGTVAGWMAGAAIDAANEAAGMINDATMASPLSTTLSPSDGSSSRPYVLADLFGAVGGIFATRAAAGAMASTNALSPTSTLDMTEVTFGTGELFFQVPINGTGQSLHLVALPRINLTEIAQKNLSPQPITPNPNC